MEDGARHPWHIVGLSSNGWSFSRVSFGRQISGARNQGAHILVPYGFTGKQRALTHSPGQRRSLRVTSA